MRWIQKTIRSLIRPRVGQRQTSAGFDSAASELRASIANDPFAVSLLDKLLSENERIIRQAYLWRHVVEYNAAIADVLGAPCPAPTYPLHSSWQLGTPLGDAHNRALFDMFVAVELQLIEELDTVNVEGAVLEFGVFEGSMLERLLDKAEAIRSKRHFYGFDSFEGLSEPSPEHDNDHWQKGQFAARYDDVAHRLRLSERPHLSLIKGWLNETLNEPEAQSIGKVAYARIDVDIYEPTVDCLAFLSNRLSQGAILMFDDWPYSCNKGESKAFFEWVATVPHLSFEWIGQVSWRVYFRVWHRGTHLH